MAGSQASCKQQGSIVRQRKAGTFRPAGNYTFWVIRVWVADKESWGRRESPVSNCNLLLIVLSLDKISLTDKKYSRCSDGRHFWSKLNGDRNPSSPWSNGAGMKIRKVDPQTPPSPVNIPALHLLLFSRSVMSQSLWPCELRHTTLPCPSPSLRICSNSCPLNQRCMSLIPG